GKELLRLDRKAQRQLAPHFARIERELASAARQHAGRRPAALVLHASHDLTLETLRDLAQSRHLRLELHFKGSLESLESFARGASEIAGFHVPGRLLPDQALRYRKWLKPESVQIIHLFYRQQGLVVARGNPKRIQRLRDLARPSPTARSRRWLQAALPMPRLRSKPRRASSVSISCRSRANDISWSYATSSRGSAASPRCSGYCAAEDSRRASHSCRVMMRRAVARR
ncbi:MAG: substrate-binding domain-containing protein, partial [Betaproteobacteria bacterium]|nr:substrate-binding domain-containing protein [Betaproteobacteria bacterium]